MHKSFEKCLFLEINYLVRSKHIVMRRLEIYLLNYIDSIDLPV